MIKIQDHEFKELTNYIKRNFGINLENKRVLIEGRLAMVLEQKGCKNFSEYIELLKRDKKGMEERLLLDKITTNHTYFMREPNHFKFLQQKILPQWEREIGRREARIWSAGCSTGAEAYTTAMTIEEFFRGKQRKWKSGILATDISQEVLAKAVEGVYSGDLIKDVPENWKRQYFSQVRPNQYQISAGIREQVTYKSFNLMEPFRFGKPFDLIFCRNVMIYFDQKTREQLINKYYEATKVGGYLFIGHSETIVKESSRYKYIMPAIYQRVE